jgi:membrane associated rhomboid family serine protease
MQISISSIKGTVGLILLNFLVFMVFGFSGSSATDTTTLQCLKSSHPECLTLAPMDSVARCATSDPKGNLELCTYDLKPQCQNDPAVLRACYPQGYVKANSLSFIPALFGNGKQMYAVVTSMFMHANFAHLWGNMIFLFLVGIFIERRLGTAKFLLFYLLVGIGGTLFYFIFNQTSQIALLGASGAISGLMGANLILDFFKSNDGDRPYFKAQTLVIFIFYQFVFQMLDPGGQIAYLGHIGGFITGAILIFYFKKKDEVYTPTPTY